MKTKEMIEAIRSNYPPENYSELREALDHCLTLLKAESEGRLLILPCKVGDTVWKIVRHRVDVSGYRMEWEWETCIEAVKFSIGVFEAIGKTVFLTREEAEAALRGGADG